MLKLKRRGQFLNQKGFTLIELMVVVVILGILAAIVVPKFTDQAEKARQKAAIADLKSMKNAIDLNAAENKGYYPDDGDDVYDVLEKAGIKDPKDPWTNNYNYVGIGTTGHMTGYYIWSLGKDGTNDNDDDIYATEKDNPKIVDTGTHHGQNASEIKKPTS